MPKAICRNRFGNARLSGKANLHQGDIHIHVKAAYLELRNELGLPSVPLAQAIEYLSDKDRKVLKQLLANRQSSQQTSDGLPADTANLGLTGDGVSSLDLEDTSGLDKDDRSENPCYGHIYLNGSEMSYGCTGPHLQPFNRFLKPLHHQIPQYLTLSVNPTIACPSSNPIQNMSTSFSSQQSCHAFSPAASPKTILWASSAGVNATNSCRY